jgi:sulfur carrier protein
MHTAATKDAITLTVNGEERLIPELSTISTLLLALNVDPRMVVVEHNRTILRDRARYADMKLNAGDVVEIVQFVGGG